MARILYGVQSDGTGHIVRALTVARNLPEHQFTFVCNGSAAQKAREEYPVLEMPGLDAVVEGHRTKYLATVGKTLGRLTRLTSAKKELIQFIEKWQPDIALTDFEFLLPWSSSSVGLPCLSLDHQHILTACQLDVPPREIPSYLIDRTIVSVLLNLASFFIVTSFFHPPLKNGATTRLVGPVLRNRVIQRNPIDRDHILAFKGFSGFERVIPFLKNQKRPVLIYGYDIEQTDGNLIFKKKSVNGFLDDLASCAYVICGGGHTLCSEAFYFGKPVLSFPGAYFEQRCSSAYAELLGYGAFQKRMTVDDGMLRRFESRLGEYKSNIKTGSFCGNEDVVSLINLFVAGGPMDRPLKSMPSRTRNERAVASTSFVG